MSDADRITDEPAASLHPLFTPQLVLYYLTRNRPSTDHLPTIYRWHS